VRSTSRGFIWVGNAYTPLGEYLGLARNDAQAMNNAGDVVGTAWTSAGWPMPWRWRAGIFTALPSFGGTNGGAFDLNDSGQITGYSYVPPEPFPVTAFFAFLYADNTIRCLGEEPGTLSSTGQCMNDLGELGVSTSDAISFTNRGAFASLGIGLHDIGTLGGVGMRASPNGINNLGHICGWSETGVERTNDSWDADSFIWRDNVMTRIADLPGHSITSLLSINDSDVCIGVAFPDAGGTSKAIVCIDQQVHDLNTLIPAGSGLALTRGNFVKNNGRIGCNGTLNGQPSLVILTPNP
jgi:uncharacterized membrane protein